jgi:hypothetical protein
MEFSEDRTDEGLEPTNSLPDADDMSASRNRTFLGRSSSAVSVASDTVIFGICADVERRGKRREEKRREERK